MNVGRKPVEDLERISWTGRGEEGLTQTRQARYCPVGFAKLNTEETILRLTRTYYRGALRLPHRRLRRSVLVMLALSTFSTAIACGYMVGLA